MNVLFWTTPAAGHVNPGLPIARALVQRGHDVRWYTGGAFQADVEATGAIFAPMVEAFDQAAGAVEERFPERAGLAGLAGFKFDLKHLFLDEAPHQLADVRRLLAEQPADVIVADNAVFGAAFLSETAGQVFATFGITVLTLGDPEVAPFGTGLTPGGTWPKRLRNRALSALTEKVLFRDVAKHERAVRTRVGAPARVRPLLESTTSPYLFLQPSTPAFEYPRRALPPQMHWIGPLLPTPRPAALPDWWHELDDDRPVVLVTQGTVATGTEDLIQPALHALAGEDVLVVVAGAADLAAVPANARVEHFVPFGALLPKVDVMVTNGGFGGVQFALAHGVPLVVSGTTEEKPEVAGRIAWSGAGLDLRAKQPSPDAVRSAVRRVLDEPGFRAAARLVAASYAEHHAPQEAADLLEELGRTGQPVTTRPDSMPNTDRWVDILS